MLNKILRHPLIARKIIHMASKPHNFSYNINGGFSTFLEPDGLHPKHRLIKYHVWFMKRLESNWQVLAIGCGNGALSYNLKEKCESVTGIDISASNIEIAKSRFKKEGITYICADATKFE